MALERGVPAPVGLTNERQVADPVERHREDADPPPVVERAMKHSQLGLARLSLEEAESGYEFSTALFVHRRAHPLKYLSHAKRRRADLRFQRSLNDFGIKDDPLTVLVVPPELPLHGLLRNQIKLWTS